MTIEEFNRTVALQQTIATEFQPIAKLVNDKEQFGKLDHLTKDLILIQANQMNALLGTLQVRLGLGAGEVKEALAKQEAQKEVLAQQKAQKKAGEKEAPAVETSEKKSDEATKGTVETK